MNNLLQQIVAGAEAGSYYALIGLAIVVVMKSTDVPNFAQAEMGLLAAYMCWWRADGDQVGWPFWFAILVGLLFATVFGAAVRHIRSRLDDRPSCIITGRHTLRRHVLLAIVCAHG